MIPDVVVVGGGPAGSTVAWRLARAGGRVLLLDAARFPRVKLCAGWVTRKALADLELTQEAYPHTLQAFRTVSVDIDGSTYASAWPRVASYGIVREQFDTYLLQRAAVAGAVVQENTRVRAVRPAGRGYELDTSGGRISAPLVIGAGGHGCPVARALGNVRPDESVIVTQESETRVGAERLRALTPSYGTPELFAEPDFHGYGWYFTKGDFLNVGVGAQGGLRIADRMARLLDRLRAMGRLPIESLLTSFKGHAYSVRRSRPRQVAGRDFLLVGDGAGMARDLSGEGIGPAVRSACLAADAVASGRLDGYPAQLDAAFGSPSAIVGSLATWLPDRILVGAARLACVTPWTRRKWLLEGAFGIG
ncbi:MAG TPA: geranylgeranyl reductase family protein [Candidatus Binatia bacterium]|nr:geranylgeranyl reductase family protein [Candidatus Binatia bacterium]